MKEIVISESAGPPRVRSWTISSFVGVCVVPLGTFVSNSTGIFEYSDIDIGSTLQWSLIIALTAILIMALWHQCMQSKRAGPISVLISPIGVQLSNLPSGSNRSTTTLKRDSLLLFVLAEDIYDCVVHEQILAHKVKTVLLLRLKNKQFIDIGYGLDLSYTECFRYRRKVMNGLQEYGIACEEEGKT